MRYQWWKASFYWPRRAAALFTATPPHVQEFPNGHKSELAKQLAGVNVSAPTEMCRIMTRHGSDKGRGWHNYTTVYAMLFHTIRDKPLRIFELGLGTNNPELISTMGVGGRPGASLRGWREIFPKALVYGADIDRSILFEEPRIKTYYCDQLDRRAIDNLWAQSELAEAMDILIDDGLHTLPGNISFLEGSLGHLRPGGTYIVEDIGHETIAGWSAYLETTAKQFPNHEFALVRLPNSLNEWDNNLLIIHRRPS